MSRKETIIDLHNKIRRLEKDNKKMRDFIDKLEKLDIIRWDGEGWIIPNFLHIHPKKVIE